jgi:hypothetical protein
MPAARRASAAVAAWTLLVWTTRIGTIWGDDDLSTAARMGRLALALSFTALAVATLVLLLSHRPALVAVVRVLAAWTIVVWSVRAVGIALGDHSAAFVVVHLVLAVVSVALAVAAVRRTSPNAVRAAAAQV